MEADRVLREARRRAGASQRALAQRSGVSVRTIAAVEAGARQPTVALLSRLLTACGQHLAVQDGTGPATDACAHLRQHLRLSTTERWLLATRATGRSEHLHRALDAAGRDLVLEPAASVPLWVPGAS